ncbi:hypothetical protein E2C01_068049 [Portunus trituberculatus]|uniref:Uncharacterized protein n=1 Tax=Portunus trituberculatus TaxID=210409 RepID=A0A5B7HQZ4_PORTR|nr:hypothetical protein [Portunus trituberculatus]
MSSIVITTLNWHSFHYEPATVLFLSYITRLTLVSISTLSH